MSEDPKQLMAHYESPAGTKDFNLPLSAKCPTNPSVEEKTAYLSELRASTKKLQEDINAFLTQKMAEDKAREANPDVTDSKSKAKKRDEVEEENYGEDALEEDG